MLKIVLQISSPYCAIKAKLGQKIGNHNVAHATRPFSVLRPVFENTYFMFFSDFKKKHDFLRFFEMTYQKVVKSL